MLLLPSIKRLKFRRMLSPIRNRVLRCFRYHKSFSCAAACVVLSIGVGCESMTTSKTLPEPPLSAFTDIYGKAGSLKILFLGDGRGDLPGVQREFQAVVETLSPVAKRGYLHANFLLGPNLTRYRLESKVQNTQYSIVYYAGHLRKKGHVVPLADSNLDTLEFLRIIHQNPPGLLIMNACNSLGDPVTLDLMHDLFQESGVVLAIGTSTVVQDDMPAKVFPQIFESLIDGKTVGEAMSDARRKYPHALDQYFLLGDPLTPLR